MKIIKTYKGWKIKQHNTEEKELTTYEYSVFNLEGEFEWNCDNVQEALDFINSY